MGLPASPPNPCGKLSFYVWLCVADYPDGDGPSTWHSVIATFRFQNHSIQIRQILLSFYLRGYPRWLETVRTLTLQGLHLLPSSQESCIPAFLLRIIRTPLCKNTIKTLRLSSLSWREGTSC
jgi:hypothetical protein